MERVLLNDYEEEIPRKRKWKGKDLRKLWKIPEGNKLFKEIKSKDKPDKLIKDNDIEHLRPGNSYYDLPPGTVS